MKLVSLLGVAAVALPLITFGDSQELGFTSLDAEAQPLKTAFTADAGKVRVLMYVSPT